MCVSWASILSVYPGYPGNIIATEALWFVNWTRWSFCKTRGWDSMEIPNPFISTCLMSQAHEHKFYLVAAFVRAMVELNWGGIPFRKELVSHENPAWSTELLLGDRFWYTIGLYVQKLRLSPTSLKRVGKAKSLDRDLQSDTSMRIVSGSVKSGHLAIYSNFWCFSLCIMLCPSHTTASNSAKENAFYRLDRGCKKEDTG